SINGVAATARVYRNALSVNNPTNCPVVTYQITYNANGGSGAPSSQTKTHGVALTLSSTKPTKSGYNFDGWATSSSGAVAYQAGGSYTSNSSVTLYAIWSFSSGTRYVSAAEPKTYSGTTLKCGDKVVVSDCKPISSSNSTETCAVSSINGVAATARVYRNALSVNNPTNCPVATYKITYNANGGSGAPSSQTKTHGVTLTLTSNKPTRSCYTFRRWNTNSSGTGTNYSSGGSYTANSAATLYAKWTVKTYTVSYNKNTTETVTNMPSSQTKTCGKTLTLKATLPARTGYCFLGWNTKANGTGTNYARSASYTANSAVTLYARWQLNRPIDICPAS
ncbi:MAG: InlB B-repeat-containing protein, partial [Tissierellia bacterium]|nr:InlB B-repeat-containing protein [Tissierellia bacterium]